MITFDGPNKIISYDDPGTTVVLSAKDVYSRWKDWVAAGNAQYATAFRTIGGDPLGGGIFAGDYFFLNNVDGWRMQPKNSPHVLILTGNMYAEDSNLAFFLNTPGAHNVRIEMRTSSLTQTVSSGSGLSPAEQTKLDEVWRDMGLDAATPKTITENTAGTDYTEAAGAGIVKDVTKTGAVTTVARQ
jgi:hypothetical protein